MRSLYCERACISEAGNPNSLELSRRDVMAKKLLTLLGVTVSFIFGLYGEAHALQEVSGRIATDTRWTTHESPYLVVGSILIEEWATLTIEPGVTVTFDGFYSLQVDGTVFARGEEDRPILFTFAGEETESQVWEMIFFRPRAKENSVIEHCIIEYCDRGIVFADGLSPAKANNLRNRVSRVSILSSNESHSSRVSPLGLANAPWPMFRHDEYHTGQSQYFGTQVGKLKWTFQTEGEVFSSPSIGPDGTVYVGSFDGNLYAINPNDASLKWKFGTGGPIKSSPAIADDGTVYVGSLDFKLYAINSDGTLDWEYETGFGIESSPLIGPDGTIYVGSSDGWIYAFNPSGPPPKWQQSAFDSISSSPALSRDAVSPSVYVGDWEGYLHSVDASTGAREWTWPVTPVVMCPVEDPPAPGQPVPPEKLWFPTGGIFSSPAVDENGLIYFANDDAFNGVVGHESACNNFYTNILFNTGGATWKWILSYGTENVYSSIALKNNGIFYIGYGDDLLSIFPDSVMKWSFNAEGPVTSSPAIGTDGILYIASESNKVFAVDPDSGSPRWEFETDDQVKSSPSIAADGTVYIGSDDNNVYAFWDAFVISGQVTVSGDPQNLVTMTLSGDAEDEEFTNWNGQYVFKGLSDGSYTVTAEKEGFPFSPTAVNVNVSGSSATGIDFPFYTISGTVASLGTAVTDATITLSGERQDTVTSDLNGEYIIRGLPNGTYSVSATKAGLAFTPGTVTVVISGSDKGGINFQTANAYSLSGTVTLSGEGLNGATVALSGATSNTTVTDSNGEYAFDNLSTGNYTVMVTSAEHILLSDSQSVMIIDADVEDVDFTFYTISGRVTQSGIGVPSVMITLSGNQAGSTMTGSNGDYALSGLLDGSYTVTATKPGLTLSPSLDVTVSGDDVTDADFTLYVISGTVTSTSTGAGAEGASMILSGTTSSNTSTDANGFYVFEWLVNGSYTVRPRRLGFVFTPLSQSATVASADVTGVDFSGRRRLGGICPASQALGDGNDALLDMLRTFRDEVLAKTPEGRRYIAAYYEGAPEIARLMMEHPLLAVKTAQTLRKCAPAVSSAIEGRPFELTGGALSDAQKLIDIFSDKASPELNAILEDLKKDL
jgi:outer membrane protein assembly factor BamB